MRSALDSIAAFLAHTLGQHADVRHKRDACFGNRFDLRDMARAAFELHRLRAGINESFCSFHGLLRRVVTVNRHIGDEQCLFHAASRRARVMQHLFQRHTRGVLIPKHHHSHRIAHEDDVDAAFVEQSRGGIIVSRQRSDFLTALLHLAKILHGHLLERSAADLRTQACGKKRPSKTMRSQS